MDCVYLLGTIQPLNLWNQTGHCHSHLLLHTDFHEVLGVYHSFQPPKTQLHKDMTPLEGMQRDLMLKL